MKSILNFVLVVLLCTGQPVSLFSADLMGEVSDSASREPVLFANVVVEKDGVLVGGATTNIDGQYLIKDLPGGKVSVKVSYVGYKSVEKVVYLRNDRINKLKIGLATSSVYLRGVMMCTSVSGVSSRDGSMGSKRKAAVPAVVIGGVLSRPKDLPYDNQEGMVASGLLTATELNDFSKWKLWKDISLKDLSAYKHIWSMVPKDRYVAQVRNQDGLPIADAPVSLLDDEGQIIWRARTDNSGKAELWSGFFGKRKGRVEEIRLEYKQQQFVYNHPHPIKKGINGFQIEADCDQSNLIEIGFVMDVTGSMSDELDYLKEEVKDIVTFAGNRFPSASLRTGVVFYTCIGNSFTSRTSPLTYDQDATVSYITAQYTSQGGDEAVEEGLRSGLDSLGWSDKARARILFLILDQPPLERPDIVAKIQQCITDAATNGIRIIPVVASAEDRNCAGSMEYLMRSIALGTNGTYVALTDHSLIGDHHEKPTTDSYDVEIFNDLIKRLISRYVYLPPCSSTQDTQVADTGIAWNSRIITREIIDASRTLKEDIPDVLNKDFREHGDSMVEKQEQIVSDTTEQKQSSEIIPKIGFRYYPNPTSGPVTIRFEKSIREIRLADISGKLIARYNTGGKDILQIDLSGYSSGIYYLVGEDDGESFSGKVLLNR